MELRSLVADVESVADFYGASNSVSAGEFARFTRPLLWRNPTLQAIQWLPRVAKADRVDFESRARRDGLDDFAIREQSVEGLRPAGRRADYFPAYWVEPPSSNAAGPWASMPGLSRNVVQAAERHWIRACQRSHPR